MTVVSAVVRMASSSVNSLLVPQPPIMKKVMAMEMTITKATIKGIRLFMLLTSKKM